MKRIAEAAAAQLARRAPDDVPMTADEGSPAARQDCAYGPPPAARLRAIELLGAGMGLFQEAVAEGAPVALGDEDRAARIEAILERARARHEVAVAMGPG